MRTVIRGCVFLLLLVSSAQAQVVNLHASYIGGSRIFTAPLSSDPVLRNSTNELGGSFSGGVSVRMPLSGATAAELGFEAVPHVNTFKDRFGTVCTDGFRMYALEATGSFGLPISSASIFVYVGGGAGLYFATRETSIAGVVARSVSRAPAFGILTMVGMDVRISGSLTGTFEWRFRNPMITTENVFDQAVVSSNGVDYPLDTSPFTSRVNLNGNVFRLGLGWSF